MKTHVAYCGYCSIEAVDRRTLTQEENIITCTNCGGKSELVPIKEGSSFRYIKRLNNVPRKG